MVIPGLDRYDNAPLLCSLSELMRFKTNRDAVAQWLGIERNQTSHTEKVISAFGAGTGIAMTVLFSMWLITQTDIGATGSLLIISSMGASAVLLFAVPHGALSQPWPVFGGHMTAAFIGITCQQWLPSGFVTAGIAVGVAVGVMYYLRCIHPPGGASALTTVIGGSEVVDMGYQFLFYPLLLNVIVILGIAMSFNFFFPWRRYPAHINTRHLTENTGQLSTSDYVLTTEDFNAAIHKLDSFVDITEEGLTELLEQARQHAQYSVNHPDEIKRGHYYSNGNIGNLWGVRQVIDEADNQSPGKDKVIYKTVAGQNLYETGYCERETFRQWARYEVVETRGLWVKADKPEQIS